LQLHALYAIANEGGMHGSFEILNKGLDFQICHQHVTLLTEFA
jgi:hypothetical protein